MQEITSTQAIIAAAEQFPTPRPGESRSMYRARVSAYSTRRAQQEGMIRAARSK